MVAVPAHEGEQLSPGAAGVAKEPPPAGQRNWWGLAGGGRQSCTWHSRSAAPVRQRHGRQQIRQVVMGHHQGRYRFVGIVPVGKLLASQPQACAGNSRAPWHAPRIEMAVATQGLRLPVRHAAVRSGGTDPPFTQVPVATRPFK